MAPTTAREVPNLPLQHEGSIPQIGLGTWQLEGAACERVVLRALELGYRHFDTAQIYENEDAVGRALASCPREDVFVTSKVWPSHLRAPDVLGACEASLGRLATEYLDLYLIHWPNRAIPVGETVEALERLREEGKVRSWGVSNFTATHLEETLQHGRPSVNQVELHPRLRQEALARFCASRGILLTAYSPLAHGEVTLEDLLDEIGSVHGKSGPQVALRWSLQRGHVVIPKASHARHLESNLSVFDFQLSEREMQRIDRLDRGRRLIEPDFAEFDR